MGSNTTNSKYGPTRNSRVFCRTDRDFLTSQQDRLELHAIDPPSQSPPLSDEDRAELLSCPALFPYLSSGGSSGGSSSSVAYRSSFASLCTDTGGSVRLPASRVGVFGLKPTYGRISRHGVIPYASSLDTVGIITPTAADAALVLDALTANAADNDTDRDATMSDDQFMFPTSCIVSHRRLELGKKRSTQPPLHGVTVGLPASYVVDELPPAVRAAWSAALSKLASLGATVVLVPVESLPVANVRASLSAYYVLACAEAASNLAKYDGVRYGRRLRDKNFDYRDEAAHTRRHLFGEEVVRRVLCGSFVSSKEGDQVSAATKLRRDLAKDLEACLAGSEKGQADILLLPTVLSPPADIRALFPEAAGAEQPGGGEMKDGGGLDPTMAFADDIMTVGASLAGLPACSVPVEDFLGLQLVGKRHGEELLLHVARVFEENWWAERGGREGETGRGYI